MFEECLHRSGAFAQCAIDPGGDGIADAAGRLADGDLELCGRLCLGGAELFGDVLLGARPVGFESFEGFDGFREGTRGVRKRLALLGETLERAEFSQCGRLRGVEAGGGILQLQREACVVAASEDSR